MKRAAAVLSLLLLIGCGETSETGQSESSPENYESVLDLAAALEENGLGCVDPDTSLKGLPLPEDTEAATCKLSGDFPPGDVTLWVNTGGDAITDSASGFAGVVGANWGVATDLQAEDQTAAIIDAIGGETTSSG